MASDVSLVHRHLWGDRLMGKADLHIHSTCSDGMASVKEILEYVEHETDLDLIAITDHDMFDGSCRALELAAQRRYRFQVIPGMEVTTLEGHLLALGIARPIRSLQPLARTLEQIHAQGGVAVIPHPMSWLIRSIGERGIQRIVNDPSPAIYFDGIETLNPTFAGRVTAEKTRRLNRQLWNLPETGGSDAHTLRMIGTGTTRFPGHTVEDFLAALRAHTTRAEGHFWTRRELCELVRIGPRQAFRALVVLPGRHLWRAIQSTRRFSREA